MRWSNELRKPELPKSRRAHEYLSAPLSFVCRSLPRAKSRGVLRGFRLAKLLFSGNPA